MTYSKRPAPGQATMANSEPVVIASDQSAIPVTATNLDVQSGGADLATSTQAGAIQTAVELLDDTVATLGTTTYAEAVNKGLVVGAVRRDANTTLVGTTNEVAPLQVNATGELKVAQIAALPAGTNTIGAVNGQVVDDAAVTLGTTRPFVVGGVAVAMDGTDPLAVSAEGDAALFRTDPNRIQLINQTHPRYFRASADYASAQTNTSVVASPGASLSLWITDIIISNGATAGNITLLDGSGGSVLLELYPAINGGLTHSFRNPIKLTAATALCLTSTTVTTHTITVTGYIAA